MLKYIRSKKDDGAIYSGPDRFIYDPDGGLATYFKKAQNKSVANFFFLPVSPLYLCAASLSANHTGPYNVENIVNRFRFGTRSHMSHAYQGRVSEGLFCNTYLRLLRWVDIENILTTRLDGGCQKSLQSAKTQKSPKPGLVD